MSFHRGYIVFLFPPFQRGLHQGKAGRIDQWHLCPNLLHPSVRLFASAIPITFFGVIDYSISDFPIGEIARAFRVARSY